MDVPDVAPSTEHDVSGPGSSEAVAPVGPVGLVPLTFVANLLADAPEAESVKRPCVLVVLGVVVHGELGYGDDGAGGDESAVAERVGL